MLRRLERQIREDAVELGLAAVILTGVGGLAVYNLQPEQRAAAAEYRQTVDAAETELDRAISESAREITGRVVHVEYGWQTKTVPAHYEDVPRDEPSWIKAIRAGAHPDDIVINAAFGPPTERERVPAREMRHARPWIVVEADDGEYVVEVTGRQWAKDALAQQLEQLAAEGPVEASFPAGDVLPRYSRVSCEGTSCGPDLAHAFDNTYIGEQRTGQKPAGLIELRGE